MKLSKVDKSLTDKLWQKSVVVSLGGDPEYFVANSRGKILNADAFFPGKDEPVMVKSRSQDKSKVFFDGIQAEMAFAHNTCREYVADNIRYCWDIILRRIPKGHKIVLRPSAKIQRKVLEAADPEARRFGCAPDFNAYTQSVNTPEMDASRHPFRYAGGHMHLGVANMQYQPPHDRYVRMATTADGHLKIIKFLDLMVSIPTLLLDNSPAAKRRRSKYGKAGCFRPTPYGIEYRTPSCWWLKSPMTVSIIYGLARLAWMIVGEGFEADFVKALKVDEDTIRGCIDESDDKTVKGIWDKMRPYVALTGVPTNNPLHIGSFRTTASEYPLDNYKGFKRKKLRGTAVYALAAFEYMLKNGLHSIIDKDIKREWGLDGGIPYHNGLMTGAYNRLVREHDFQKFQEDFLTNFFK